MTRINRLMIYSRDFSICLINAHARTRILLAYKKKTSHFSHISHLNLGVKSVGSVGYKTDKAINARAKINAPLPPLILEGE